MFRKKELFRIYNLIQSKNVTFSSITEPKIGDFVSVRRHFTQNDVNEFSKLSHDHNPIHCDVNFAKMFNFNEGTIVHGALLNG